jgi:hypothetical protein
VKGLKTNLIAVVAVGLVAASAVGAAAQDPESSTRSVAYTTGFAGSPVSFVEPTEESVPGGRQMRGLGYIDIPVNFSDARLAGLMSISANGAGQDFADGFANLESRTYRITNDDGAWTGSGDYIVAGGSEPPGFIEQESVVLTGDGAYDGLVAYLFIEFTSGNPELEAVILEVERAPYPEPVAVE